MKNVKQHTPILYSYRRCPYAMRARMALIYADIPFEIREISFQDKPSHMLQASPKGTVPVLILTDGTVIDESRDIMRWALEQNDPDKWLSNKTEIALRSNQLIDENDTTFKTHLDHYKYADRHPDHPASYYRDQCVDHLQQLDKLLQEHKFLTANQIGVADIAIMPFVRQFSKVDLNWWDSCELNALQAWLSRLIDATIFSQAMVKHPTWDPKN